MTRSPISRVVVGALALAALLVAAFFYSPFRGGSTAAAQVGTPQKGTEGAAQDVSQKQDADDLAEFNKKVQEYVAMHKKLAAALDIKLTETSSQEEIAAHEKALGAVLRQARINAKRGDIFDERAAKVFKTIIAADFKERTGQKKRLEGDEVPKFTPVLNQTYPSSAALATFPATLLAALPKHPEEVEYRLVSNDLILRDIEANIIVDYIPNVLPVVP